MCPGAKVVKLRGHQRRARWPLSTHPLLDHSLSPQAAEEVDRAAAAAGKLGVSTNRFVDEQRSDLALPPGAEWKPVRVAFKRCVGGFRGRLLHAHVGDVAC